jgi:hypothetical protein
MVSVAFPNYVKRIDSGEIIETAVYPNLDYIAV